MHPRGGALFIIRMRKENSFVRKIAHSEKMRSWSSNIGQSYLHFTNCQISHEARKMPPFAAPFIAQSYLHAKGGEDRKKRLHTWRQKSNWIGCKLAHTQRWRGSMTTTANKGGVKNSGSGDAHCPHSPKQCFFGCCNRKRREYRKISQTTSLWNITFKCSACSAVLHPKRIIITFCE